MYAALLGCELERWLFAIRSFYSFMLACRFAEVVARMGVPPSSQLARMFSTGFKEFKSQKSSERRNEFLHKLCVY